MRFIPWRDLPQEMQTEEVRPYYEALSAKKGQLRLKRMVDIVGAFTLLVVLSPLFLVLALAIKVDSPGPVFYRQTRVTQYGREFRIFKFRTMCDKAERIGSAVTTDADPRITRVGSFIRNCRLDEISQLIDILRGTMTFVGTRPEVPKYVAAYSPEMLATLLLPAGVTSTASIRYKDEARLLTTAQDVDEVYTHEILPAKMAYNLADIKAFSLIRDAQTAWSTVAAVLRK